MMANITEEADDNSFPEEHSDEEEISNPEDEDDEGDDESLGKNDSVARLLQQLKNSGAIRKVEKVAPPISIPFKSDGLSIKPSGLSIKPVAPINRIPHCNTCDLDFDDNLELNTHLIEHVKLPFIVLERLQSDDEGDDDNVENWSDEEIEQETEIPSKSSVTNSDILKKLGGGISINKPPVKDVAAALKPGVLKAIIKKVPINANHGEKSPKSEPNEDSPIEKIATTGSLKLTIKHSTAMDNFQVVSSSSSNGNVDVKTEPPPPVVTSTMAPVVTTSSSLPKSWETVDTKEGILDSNLIKKESVLPDTSSVSTPSSSLPMPPSRIKDEPGIQTSVPPVVAQPAAPIIPKPMIIPKKEPESSVAIIEINGDDSDNDDIMFVDSTPPVEKKPTIGVVPTAQITELPTSVSNFNSNQLNSSIYSGNNNMRTPTTPMTPMGSTEKQHNFNWNAPTKSLESILTDKSPDAIFQSLLESHRKDGNSDLGTSEYISLDTLGPKHTCEVCQTRFTDLRMLENHKRATGHSTQIVTAGASSNAIVPSTFGGNSSLMAMNNLFPVKQLAEVAGKLAGASNTGFSHQQNIMVNIHSFPQNVPPQMPGYAPQQMPGYQPGYRMPDPNQGYIYPQGTYNQYTPQPGAPPIYPNAQVPSFSSQYPHQQQPYASHYPGQMPPTSVPNQMPGMGQPGQMMGQPGQMGQPSQMMGQPGQMMGQHGQMPGTTPTSIHDTTGQQSPNKMGVMGGIKIQNSQSPAPGQKLTQAPGARIGAPVIRGQLRAPMRGRGGRGGIRPMGGIRPGAPGQGQIIRGGKPMIRTPIKRPAESSPNTTPTKKRLDMLLPDKHDNEDCHVVSLQKQREGVPFIESIKGRQESVQLGSGLTVTKTKVVRQPTPPPQTKDASAVANMLAQRGIKITAKPKSPSPPPVVIPNLGSDICIKKKPTSSFSSASFHIPEEKDNALSLKCDMCHMSYSSFSQLQEHKRQFHNVKSEMGLPVVDLSNENNLLKLSNLGIMNFIPLANREQSGGCYGVPIVSVHNALNGNLNTSLQSLGAGGILSLGPVKPLPKC